MAVGFLSFWNRANFRIISSLNEHDGRVVGDFIVVGSVTLALFAGVCHGELKLQCFERKDAARVLFQKMAFARVCLVGVANEQLETVSLSFSVIIF
jgi:hypothetical protein